MRVRGKSRHPRHLFLVSTGDKASPAIAFLGPAFGDQDSLQGVKMNLQNKTKQNKTKAHCLYVISAVGGHGV